jgi:hypothetical protein
VILKRGATRPVLSLPSKLEKNVLAERSSRTIDVRKESGTYDPIGA